jgi:hypothetical protein
VEPITSVLGGIVIAMVSGSIGKSIGTHNRIKRTECDQIRAACKELICEKIDHLGEKIDEMKKVIDGKVIGL